MPGEKIEALDFVINVMKEHEKDLDQLTERLENTISKIETYQDIIKKLEETKQIYIVGHDIPLSISKTLFNLLDARRKAQAATRGIPEIQYEFEDIIGSFLGL